ncbi:hypothetical protein DEO72_LG11g2256 [Vigna unguiculata]|uniref:Uncharacterized protein n=1 Tax=Vigna unguiculata TaxID=3917 RepID=A0A4D6NU08_VIGUN|nr:hypothetical protein DEO72_LG11g2256 [Vigna unguiculata]
MVKEAVEGLNGKWNNSVVNFVALVEANKGSKMVAPNQLGLKALAHRVRRPLKQPRSLILHSLAKISALALPFSLHRSFARVWVLPFFALTQPHSTIHLCHHDSNYGSPW